MEIFDFIKKFFDNTEKPGETAKERLKVMIVHDRLNVNRLNLSSDSEVMRQIKDDIIAVLVKYFDITREEINVDLEPSDKAMILSTTLPVIRMRKQDEAVTESVKTEPNIENSLPKNAHVNVHKKNKK